MDDVFLDGVVDLFGDPVPRSRGKKGRPAHVPTEANRRMVQLALATGKDEERIAAMLRIKVPTLRRHYHHELAGKAVARDMLDMKNLAGIVAQVEAGKTAAMALLAKRLDKLHQRETAERYQAREPKPAGSGYVSKKKAERDAAKEVGGKYAPRPQPQLLN